MKYKCFWKLVSRNGWVLKWGKYFWFDVNIKEIIIIIEIGI